MSKLPLGLASILVLAAACGGNVVSGTGASGSGASGTGAGTTGTGAGTGTGASTTGTGAGTTGTGASTTGTGASTTGTGASTGTGGSVGAGCPASAPTVTSCAGVPDQLRCTYGSSVRPDCRDVWQCLNGEWLTQNGGCSEPPPGECGTTQPPPQTVCANMGDVCTYGDTICFCDCGGGLCASPVDWLCSSPPPSPCPPIAPNDGTACAAEGAQCNYGSPCTPSGAVVNCTNGRWVWNLMIACAG
jgi:hypothetical protein